MAKRPRKKTSPKGQKTTSIGTLRLHPRGFGFVTLDNETQDVFIPKHLTNNAIDGDQVEITINPHPKSEKGPDGKIVGVLSRAHTHLAGIISFIERGRIMAHSPALGETRPIVIKKKKEETLSIGDRLVLKVLDWGDQKQPILCEVFHKIGHISDPSCDIEAAVEEYNLSSLFPKKVVEEAKKLGTSVTKEDLKNRLDLSKMPCITIDPDTAKDFDDALSIMKDKNGYFFLGVHIADVAHYVDAGSALDKEAVNRSNSTYFPGHCIPMLPEELSNNLCSLRQGVIRLTVSVLMEFDPDGNLLKSEVKRSYIKSKKRLTYGEAKDILEGKMKSPHASSIKEMAALCKLLKAKRSARGSIDFALPELIIVVDDNGKPTGVKIEQYHITHQLVEEFMLKANETVARHLHDQGKELIFRIHEEPATENLEAFFSTARSMGVHIPAKPSPEDLQKLFQQTQKDPFTQLSAVGVIRNLTLAYYSPRNVGHYGLALEHYCHFTSPIRRYSDLIVMRLLFNEEDSRLNLEEISRGCSEKERVSFRAEMGVKALKKHRLLLSWQKEDPHKIYPAYITKIKPFGLYFEVRKLFLEGFLHISELENDYFIFDPKQSILTGEKTGIRYTIGHEIQVRPLQIDLIHLEAKWELV